MKRLITGTGTSGSWQIRGSQLGAAIGACVDPNPRRVRDYEQMILVKRPKMDALNQAQTARVPVVYDVVDAWQQQVSNDAGRASCMRWLESRLTMVKPVAFVTATRAMADDCAKLGLPVLALPHHARPEQAANPIRETVTRVGYEGSERYLGHWKPFLDAECARRGWTFTVNPSQLADLDIVVACREETGYAPRHWKSNVKLANAQGSGTPCVLNREAGYTETACGAECWADTEEEMVAAFDELTDQRERYRRHERLLKAAPLLHGIARTYKAWLDSLGMRVAA